MSLLERTIEVHWRHQVHFTEGVFDPTNATLRDVLVDGRPAPFHRTARALVIIDEALAFAQSGLVPSVEAYFRQWPEELELAAAPVVLIGGETVKNAYFRVSEIHALIDRHHIDRHAYVIAIGGGAMLDMVGLAAATAHRGIRLIRIPTTTLAQDDSGVGVKNGINAFGKKNFIGTFTPPFAVINDFLMLATLSARDKRAGYVEAVKVACIRDQEFFGWLEDHVPGLVRFEAPAMKHLIYRSAELHLNHIATGGDPFEYGSARPLDFGHWAAHKLEQLSEYRLRHGEAVAIGIALDVTYARLMGYLQPSAAARIITLLEQLGFELFAKELMYEDDAGQYLILNGIEEFREHLGGELTITLLTEIGAGFEVHEVNKPAILTAMKWLEARHSEVRQTLAARA